ncbi:uncharacterized protein [Venturia canescens]|uniref:uncharacterized protein n=1 Tax=Venturia canescens TaxID=32260 RepID=UPI001C9CDC89|nr:uncharacterized protein LOC122417430 [Venturia canescens]
MTREYGPATWFLTISPSEWLWDDLFEHLREVNDIPADVKVNPMELIVNDPISTSRFMNIKFKGMLDFITSSAEPLGKVEHYFWRLEYQTRGAPHFHLLLWVKDAPVIGKSSRDEIISFIMKYVTCRMPDKNVSPELYRRVNAHQKHIHNSYCLRSKKTKTGFSRRCKFGHPRPLTQTFQLRDVAVSIAGRKKLKSRSRLYDLPHGKAEANINDYNPAILCAWQGNMDIQFIGEQSTVLTAYVTKYVSKPEKSNFQDPFDIINSSKSLVSCLWNWAMRLLSHRECGALEAADSILGHSLWGTDPKTTIKWFDVNIIRKRKLKSRKDIESLDPESTDLFYPPVIDTYYPNRPAALESMNLFDFARWYDVTKIKPKTISEVYEIGPSTFLKKCSRACLINHYMYNVKTEPERYYHTLLLLFKAWRDVADLRNNQDTYAEAFSSMQIELADALRYHDKIEEIQQAIRMRSH